MPMDMIFHGWFWSFRQAWQQFGAVPPALLDIDQKAMAELAGVSLPTIQRMEASQGNV